MVSDVRGVLPPHQSSLASIADARRRLLRPGGIMIPARDTIWAALVRDEKLHDSYVGPWTAHGFDLHNFRRRATNLWKKELTPADRLVSPPQAWATLDYPTLESYDVEGAVNWAISRDTPAHGLAAWFDSTLIEGVEFSNAPGLPEVIYGRAFFPWPEAVELRAGDTVTVKLRAKSAGEKYIWAWDTSVLRGGRREVHFQQSDILGEPVVPAELRKRSPQYRPALTEAGEVERQILTRIDGQASVEEIALEIYTRFKGRFQSLEEARQAVADVSQRWC
jgi:protein arginine N-methyltransferase 1